MYGSVCTVGAPFRMTTEITHGIVHDFPLVSRYINKLKKENIVVTILLLSFFR